MSHSLVLNQHRVLTSENLRDILRMFQWSDGVDLSMGRLASRRQAQEISNAQGQTEFPITKIRLLKGLRLKVGKASTERTGHLGIVALILTIHIGEYTRKEEPHTIRSTRHQLESLVNPKMFKSDKD